jgi:hypothetical protein
MAHIWLEAVVDAFLEARHQGHSPEAAVKIAERTVPAPPHRALTRQDLKTVKGIGHCRQYMTKLLRDRKFPQPFDRRQAG